MIVNSLEPTKTISILLIAFLHFKSVCSFQLFPFRKEIAFDYFLCKFSVICEACCLHETNNVVNYQFINQGMKDLFLKQRQIIFFWGLNKKIRFNCTLQWTSRINVISFISRAWYSFIENSYGTKDTTYIQWILSYPDPFVPMSNRPDTYMHVPGIVF